MAQLKDLLVSGASRFIGDIYGNKIQLTSLNVPTTAGGTTYGTGTSGNYLRSNGTSVYWGALDTSGTWSGNAATATKLQTARTINGTSFDGSANITTANWGTTRTLTIGATGKSVNGSANVSWSINEIMGSSDSSKFYRGDKTWSNTLAGKLIIYNTGQYSGESYSGGIELREYNVETTNSTQNLTNAPGISFHWGGRWVHKLNLQNDKLNWDNNVIPHTGNTTGTVGGETQPVYVNAGTITAITTGIATAYGGTGNTSFTATRLVYSNTATKLASTTITSDGAYLGSVSYLSVNTEHQTSYRLRVNGLASIGALDGGQHIINGNVQINSQSGSYNEGLRINRSTTGYANIYLGGTRSSASGNQTGGWWIGTLSTPADATSNDTSITNTVFTISNNSTADTLSIKGTRGATIGTNSGWAIRPRLAVGTTYQTSYTLYINGISYIQTSSSNSGTAGLTINNGLLKITNYSNTVTIGSANTGWCHFENSANINFYFNKAIHSVGGFTVYNTSTSLTNNQLTFDSGGGWYMSDTSWIRTYGSKNVYQNTGIIRTDGQFQVGGDGSKFYANSSGNGYFSNILTIDKTLVANSNTKYKFNTDSTLFFVNKDLSESWNNSSYYEWVYLLIPVLTSTNQSAMNYIDGVLNLWKQGGNVYDTVRINLNCCYNSLEYYLDSFGQSNDWKLVTCTYNGIKYYALKGYYHANPYNATHFCGHVRSDLPGGNNTSTKPLSLPYAIAYYNYTSNSANAVVLNSEIYNSISDTLTDTNVTSVSRRSLSNAGGFVGPLTGNASSATSFSSNATVALTGDATGTSAGSTKSWSVPVTLANSGVTAGSYGPSANASPAHSGTFSVPYITVDAKGRVTSASTKTITLPASGNTDSNVSQTATTTSASYEVLFSATADNTTRTEGARKSNKLTFNPSSGLLTSTISKATELNTSNCGTAAPTSSTAHAGGTGSLYFQYGTTSSSTIDPDIDKIYPVGSIYLSLNSANPSTFFGGTWEQIAQGRTLFGAGTLNSITYTAGQTKDAGLPNLSGMAGRSYSDYNLNNTGYSTYVTGPFYQNESDAWGTSTNTVSGSNDAVRNIRFDASRQNSIYGNSTTVQPPAFIVYMWKRTA